MKIKSIAAICKKNKQVVLFNRYSDSGTISQYRLNKATFRLCIAERP